MFGQNRYKLFILRDIEPCYPSSLIIHLKFIFGIYLIQNLNCLCEKWASFFILISVFGKFSSNEIHHLPLKILIHRKHVLFSLCIDSFPILLPWERNILFCIPTNNSLCLLSSFKLSFSLELGSKSLVLFRRNRFPFLLSTLILAFSSHGLLCHLL